MRAISRSRKTMSEIVHEVKSAEHTFIRKMLIYQSPITDDFEYRVAYFTSPEEAAIWEGEMTKKYVEMKIPHQCYTSYIER